MGRMGRGDKGDNGDNGDGGGGEKAGGTTAARQDGGFWRYGGFRSLSCHDALRGGERQVQRRFGRDKGGGGTGAALQNGDGAGATVGAGRAGQGGGGETEVWGAIGQHIFRETAGINCVLYLCVLKRVAENAWSNRHFWG